MFTQCALFLLLWNFLMSGWWWLLRSFPISLRCFHMAWGCSSYLSDFASSRNAVLVFFLRCSTWIFLARSALRCKGILCQERRLLFSKSSWEPFGIPHLSWSRDVQRILEMINYGLLLSFPFSGSSLLVSRIFATFPRCAKQCTLLSS